MPEFIPDLEQIQILRKKLDMTQAELAKAVGINANMIAQIETGRAKPSYDNMKKIFNFFSEKVVESEKTVLEVSSETITWLSLNDTLAKAKDLMNKQKFDCVPVRDDVYNLKGKITTWGITKLSGYKRNDSEIFIREILEESPPTVPYDTPTSWVLHFLRPPGCVLVTAKGTWKGIVTLWDVVTKDKE